ncbi:MAG: hypothetical protein KGO01_18990, partial [Burkholderiales bacterium]|nr:hypothetical protein [Burkholderiales bacterium]
RVLVLGIEDHAHRAIDHLGGKLRGLPHLGSILNRRSLLKIRGGSGILISKIPQPCPWLAHFLSHQSATMVDLNGRSAMAQNKVQYQRGLSMPEFFEEYGSVEQCEAMVRSWR